MPSDALHTPLHALHLCLGASMLPFAGYAMPVQYPVGLLKEHLHTRAQAGLFDVSHMGQIRLTARSGDRADAARALETLLPIDVLGLAPGRQRYGMLLNASGGILDDLMVAQCGDSLILVVNAANKAADAAYLRAHLTETCEIAVLPRALLALQGPGAEAALARLAPEVVAMRFMDVRVLDLLGASALVTRSGYTGEDGFEISVPEDRAEALAEALLTDDTVWPIGLGARDSLRLEAGLCLHGADIDATTDPVEAGLTWAIPAIRRRGGARAGGFPGAGHILDAIATGPSRKRVGLRPESAAPVRGGATLFADATGEPIGHVTSGGFGPSLQAPIAMGYLPVALAKAGTRVFAEVRGKRLPLVVSALPFVPAGFKRA
ncbi:glycine cleavage system aminomethyltransferase GcvT [Methylobacterium sp. BTF04]|uniref:glycine cleavage system aminomethyltransferase GcvT n=1 Tax=Methylobacterium sp. BTF04 TaxID=2708300 RepID=UPI0013D56640|nr:glycine cleavage system aminomethyltransferase GcvT [Methylobacterium sp. BTF04]NEU11186.1 glycine cleavage system aminomethyltransferase GcvT [Methylobacterium sp. BTF04]